MRSTKFNPELHNFTARLKYFSKMNAKQQDPNYLIAKKDLFPRVCLRPIIDDFHF